jgi:hypothetical protein
MGLCSLGVLVSYHYFAFSFSLALASIFFFSAADSLPFFTIWVARVFASAACAYPALDMPPYFGSPNSFAGSFFRAFVVSFGILIVP